MHDSKGNVMDVKDEVIARGTIIEFRGGLAIVELAADPTKKYHIEGAHLELVARTQKPVLVEDPGKAPAGSKINENEAQVKPKLQFNEATEYMKSKGHSPAAAKAIVYAHGVPKILADKAKDQKGAASAT